MFAFAPYGFGLTSFQPWLSGNGHLPSNVVTHNGEIVTHNGVAVTYSEDYENG